MSRKMLQQPGEEEKKKSQKKRTKRKNGEQDGVLYCTVNECK